MIHKSAIARSLLLGASVLLCARGRALSHDPLSSGAGKPALRREVHLPVQDFSLTDQGNKPLRFEALKGKVVLVTFIYTTCPDICPLITANLRSVQEKLTSDERAKVFFLSITTDPEVDTPSVLKSYGDRYKVDFSNWLFLSGEPKSVARVWKSFGVKVERKARGLIDHTTLTALVDKQGVMRLAYYDGAPGPEVVLRDVRGLLSAR